MSLQELRQKYAGLCDKQKAIVDKAIAENRGTTPEEDTDFENLQKDIDSTAALIEKAEAVENRNNNLNNPAGGFRRPTDFDAGNKQQPVLDNGGFKNLGELVNALRFGDSTGRVANLAVGQGEGGGRKVPEAFVSQFMPKFSNEWSMGVGAEGGFAVPAQQGDKILMIQPETSIVRPRATIIPAGDPPDSAITFPAFSQGANGVFGGVTVSWIGEGATKPETDGNLEEITLLPKEVAATTVVTDKLLRNWQAAGAFLNKLLSGATAAAEDFAFIRGNGVAKPFGAINCPGTISVNRGVANTISYTDIVRMQSRLLPESVGQAMWICSVSAFPQIATLQDPAGRYIFNHGDATKGIPATLNGMPIKFTGKTPVLGVRGDLVLVDLTYYMIKDGSGPFIAASEHVLFRQNKTVIKVFWNVDGQGWVKAPLTLEDGATTVSFCVVLDVVAV
jgi:HK97 family phage major capsid protein